LTEKLKQYLFRKYKPQINKYKKENCKCFNHLENCKFSKKRLIFLSKKIKKLCKCENKKQHNKECVYKCNERKLLKKLERQVCLYKLLSKHKKYCVYSIIFLP